MLAIAKEDYSDLRKMKQHYAAWGITKNLDDIFSEIATGWTKLA
jgi:hypothetical protein